MNHEERKIRELLRWAGDRNAEVICPTCHNFVAFRRWPAHERHCGDRTPDPRSAQVAAGLIGEIELRLQMDLGLS